MGRAYKGDKLKFWSKLRVQMTISYVGVSVVSALLVELFLALVFLLVLLRLPFVDQNTIDSANYAARNYALEAAVQGGGTALDPRTTFQQGQLSSLILPAGDKNLDPTSIALALLIAPNGRVLASSDPAHYPVSTSTTRLLPAQVRIIRNALAGKAGNIVEDTPKGHDASVAHSFEQAETADWGGFCAAEAADIRR